MGDEDEAEKGQKLGTEERILSLAPNSKMMNFMAKFEAKNMFHH